MYSKLKNTLNKLIIQFYKHITVLIFFILPSKVTSVFVKLSILVLIYNTKNIDISTKIFNKEMFSKLLNTTFSKEIIMLPSYTCCWFWSDDFMDKEIYINNRYMTLRDAIKDNDILFHNLRYIINILLDNIPNSFKFKLKLYNRKERIIFKHNVMDLILYS